MAQVIPVLDIKGGQVVRGVAGRRETYQPIQSKIVSGSEPVIVAQAMMAAVKSEEIYVADLDAFTRCVISPAVLKLAEAIEGTIWLDCGVRFADQQSLNLLSHANINLILASETCTGGECIQSFLAQWPDDRLALGIDLKDGLLISSEPQPGGCPARNVYHHIQKTISAKFSEYFMIDIARVGGGVANSRRYLKLARFIDNKIKQADPGFEGLRVTFGGGLTADDIAALPDWQTVLASSAIHDGSLRIN